MSPRINHVGGCFDDLPEGTIGTVVVNAPSVVWAQFLQHAEADEPTEFLSRISLRLPVRQLRWLPLTGANQACRWVSCCSARGSLPTRSSASPSISAARRQAWARSSIRLCWTV